MVGEIGRCADRNHAEVRSDAHGDHVFGHLFAQAFSRVESLRLDVRESLVHRQLDFDIRMIGQ